MFGRQVLGIPASYPGQPSHRAVLLYRDLLAGIALPLRRLYRRPARGCASPALWRNGILAFPSEWALDTKHSRGLFHYGNTTEADSRP